MTPDPQAAFLAALAPYAPQIIGAIGAAIIAPILAYLKGLHTPVPEPKPKKPKAKP